MRILTQRSNTCLACTILYMLRTRAATCCKRLTALVACLCEATGTWVSAMKNRRAVLQRACEVQQDEAKCISKPTGGRCYCEGGDLETKFTSREIHIKLLFLTMKIRKSSLVLHRKQSQMEIAGRSGAEVYTVEHCHAQHTSWTMRLF